MMTLVTHNATAINTPDALVVAELETAIGVPPGSIVDLDALNPTGQAAATGAPDAAGWAPSDFDAVPAGSFGVSFGNVAQPVAPTGVWELVLTLAETGDPPPTLVSLLASVVDDAGTSAAVTFNLSAAELTTDGGTFTLADTKPGGTAAMQTLLGNLGAHGNDLHLTLSVILTADGVTIDDYRPSFDSIQLRINQLEASTVSNNCHMETGNCMVIAVPLDGTCAIVEDAPVHVTSAFGNFKATTEREDGTDYSSKNFGGQYCGPNQKGFTLEKWANIEGEMCLVDWALMAVTSGNVKVTDEAGNAIGYQQLAQPVDICSGAGRPRLAVTVIRAAATGDGGCVTAESSTGATSAVAYTFPNTTDWVWDIPENADKRAMVPFKAKGYASPNAGRGPLNLYPAGSTPAVIDPKAFYATYFVDPASLPDPDCDTTIAHPAPLPGAGS